MNPEIRPVEPMAEATGPGLPNVLTEATHSEALKANAIYDALLGRREKWYKDYRHCDAPEITPSIARRYQRQAVRLVNESLNPSDFITVLQDKGYSSKTIKAWQSRIELAGRVFQEKFEGEGFAVGGGSKTVDRGKERDESLGEGSRQARSGSGVVLPDDDEVGESEPEDSAFVSVSVSGSSEEDVRAVELARAKFRKTELIPVQESGWDKLGKAMAAVSELGKKAKERGGKARQAVTGRIKSQAQGLWQGGRQMVSGTKAAVVMQARLTKARINDLDILDINDLDIDKRTALEWIGSVLLGAGAGAGLSVLGIHEGLSPLDINFAKAAVGAVVAITGVGFRGLGETQEVADLIRDLEQSHPRLARIAASAVSQTTSRLMMGAGLGLLGETNLEIVLRSFGHFGGFQPPHRETAQAVQTATSMPTPTGTETATAAPAPTSTLEPTSTLRPTHPAASTVSPTSAPTIMPTPEQVITPGPSLTPDAVTVPTVLPTEAMPAPTSTPAPTGPISPPVEQIPRVLPTPAPTTVEAVRPWIEAAGQAGVTDTWELAKNMIDNSDGLGQIVKSGWPERVNVPGVEVAENAYTIAQNALRWAMAKTGTALSGPEAEELVSLVRTAHVRMAAIHANNPGAGLDALPDDLRIAYQMAEGLIKQVSKEDILRLLGR